MENRPEPCQGLPGAQGATLPFIFRACGVALRFLSVAPLLYGSVLAALATPQYQIGELAEEDIHAPAPMAVVDVARTTVLRNQAGQRIPAVFRFHSNAAGEAEAELRASFATTRSRFLQSMQTASQRTTLDEKTIAHPSFRRFVIWFQTQNPAFPMTTNLARVWALGESDQSIYTQWAEFLNVSMEQCIHGDWLPPGLTGSLQHARVVQVDDPGEVLILKSVESRGVDIKLTNLVSLSASRAALKQGNKPGMGPALGNYLAGFLKLNCFPEEELTRQIREQGTTDMVAVDRYEEGQLIVRRGQRVDSRIRAALAFLGQTEKVVQDPPVLAKAPKVEKKATASDHWRPMFFTSLNLEKATRQSLLIALVLALGGLLLIAILVRRKGMAQQRKLANAAEHHSSYTVVMNDHRNETVFMPLEAGGDSNTLPALAEATSGGSLDVSTDRFWRQRAAEAEQRSEDILNMVRAGLAPQLARQMMNKLVQELITQRAEWLQTSQVAENELVEMEKRITHSHTLLQQRLRDFEKRTEELEQLLALKTEENSELIKTQIALTQKQLSEAESSSDPEKTVLLWN